MKKQVITIALTVFTGCTFLTAADETKPPQGSNPEACQRPHNPRKGQHKLQKLLKQGANQRPQAFTQRQRQPAGVNRQALQSRNPLARNRQLAQRQPMKQVPRHRQSVQPQSRQLTSRRNASPHLSRQAARPRQQLMQRAPQVATRKTQQARRPRLSTRNLQSHQTRPKPQALAGPAGSQARLSRRGPQRRVPQR